MISEERFKKLIVITIIAILIIVSIVIIWPILLSIIAGLLLAFIFNPVYKIVFKVIKERNISSLIVILLVFFILFIPVWFLFPVVIKQIFEVYSYTQKIDFSDIFEKIMPASMSKDMPAIINSFISKLVNAIFSSSSNMLLNIPDLALKFVIILFIFFFAMRDSDKLAEYAKAISPFSQETEKGLVKQFKDVTGSVIYGYILIGVIQGMLTGIGLFIFGVKNALLLTVIAMFASIFPLLGAWLVWLPASLYLLVKGHTGAAIGLFIYGAVLVSWIDNILRPYIVARKIKISPAIVVIGLIGGLIVFGIIGIILGPLILSYLIILLEAYKNKNFGLFLSAEKSK